MVDYFDSRRWKPVYLEAKTSERIYIVAGPEFGDQTGHTPIIDGALYGLGASGARWHDRFGDCLRELGFFPCKAETDMMRRNGDSCQCLDVSCAVLGHDPLRESRSMDPPCATAPAGSSPPPAHQQQQQPTAAKNQEQQQPTAPRTTRTTSSTPPAPGASSSSSPRRGGPWASLASSHQLRQRL